MEKVPLRAIAEFIATGKTPPTKEAKYFGGDIEWYTPGDLDKGKILRGSKRTLTSAALVDKKAAIFPKGTLLISCIGDIGKLGITRLQSSSNQQITGVKPNDMADVNYLYYWFRFSKYYLEHATNTAVVPILNNRSLQKIRIPLPPLAEQKKIAAILDAADQLRQKDQQLIDHYTSLSQSLFLEMFGDPVTNPKQWPMHKLGDHVGYIGDIGSNGSNAMVAKNLVMSDLADYAIMVRTVNLNANDFTKKVKYVSKEVYEYFSKSKIFGGELIMNKIGSAGSFWIMPKLNRPVSLGLNQFVIRLQDLDSIFLYHYLSTGFGEAQINSRIRGAVTKSITKSAVKELPIFYPPMEFQKQFAESVSGIDQQSDQVKIGLEKSNLLFNSLLQKAFKGELTSSKAA